MCSFTVLGVRGVGPKTSQYLVWPPFASRSATHLLRIELIRLLIVACGMLVHSSSMAVWSCWILAGTETRCGIRRTRASQSCSMGDMSGEYAGHARTGMFSASANRSPTRRHTCCLPSALYSENQDSSVKRTPLQSARRHRMWAFAHSSRLRWGTAVRLRPRWGQRACRWASLRRFLTVCAEILWLCKPIVVAAVRVAGLRRSWKWRCWMWRSWAGVVTRGLRLWGRLDVLPNSLKRLWRRLMVEKWTFSSRATALVDIPAVSMSIARSLKTCDISAIYVTLHHQALFCICFGNVLSSSVYGHM